MSTEEESLLKSSFAQISTRLGNSEKIDYSKLTQNEALRPLVTKTLF